MIDIGIDKNGHSLRMLVAQSLRAYKTSSLYQFLEDKNSLVRTSAAREIQIRGELESFNYASELLSNKKASSREVGVFILGQLGTPDYPYKKESVPLLSSRLSQDVSETVRVAAAAALGHLKAYEALNVLIDASNDKSAEVRASVAFALTHMKRRSKAREVLRTLKNDVSESVRQWAID